MTVVELQLRARAVAHLRRLAALASLRALLLASPQELLGAVLGPAVTQSHFVVAVPLLRSNCCKGQVVF